MMSVLAGLSSRYSPSRIHHSLLTGFFLNDLRSMNTLYVLYCCMSMHHQHPLPFQADMHLLLHRHISYSYTEQKAHLHSEILSFLIVIVRIICSYTFSLLILVSSSFILSAKLDDYLYIISFLSLINCLLFVSLLLSINPKP